jgi:hypothetical protein
VTKAFYIYKDMSVCGYMCNCGGLVSVSAWYAEASLRTIENKSGIKDCSVCVVKVHFVSGIRS